MGRKVGAAVPLSGGEGLDPHLTYGLQGRGLPPCHQVALIHPTVWPQYAVTYRQDRQRTDSIRRTVLQKVDRPTIP